METIPENIATGYTGKWKSEKEDNLDQLFRVWNPSNGNSIYPDQWSRILGINFETIDANLINTIKETSVEEISFSMELAVIGEHFSVIFKFKKNSDPDYTYYTTNLSNGGRIYGVESVPPRALEKRYGISTELRNQLAYSWLISPYSVLDLFYLLAPSEIIELPVISPNLIKGVGITYHSGSAMERGTSAPVRVHSYPITDKNLKTVKKLFDELPDFSSGIENNTNLKLRFGVNTSDLFVNAELFTIILEIQTDINDSDSITYLDFVRACPPNCEES